MDAILTHLSDYENNVDDLTLGLVCFTSSAANLIEGSHKYSTFLARLFSFTFNCLRRGGAQQKVFIRRTLEEEVRRHLPLRKTWQNTRQTINKPAAETADYRT